MSKKSIALLLSVFLAFLLPSAAMASSDCNKNHRCGRIKEIVQYEKEGSKTAGVVAGAVVGGVLGNQVGGGSGKALATAAGAVGGGYAGKKIAENSSRTRFKITVRLDDGHIEVCDQGSAKNLHVGDYVKISNGKAYRL
jgi:outer membrane lipoprotein SlyB